jgi:hypothetical protein
MKKIVLTAVLTSILTFAATSLWWSSKDNGKCEFSTKLRLVPEMFMVSEDGVHYDTTYTYREP